MLVYNFGPPSLLGAFISRGYLSGFLLNWRSQPSSHGPKFVTCLLRHVCGVWADAMLAPDLLESDHTYTVPPGDMDK